MPSITTLYHVTCPRYGIRIRIYFKWFVVRLGKVCSDLGGLGWFKWRFVVVLGGLLWFGVVCGISMGTHARSHIVLIYSGILNLPGSC